MKSICFFNWYNFQNFWDSRLELKKKTQLNEPGNSPELRETDPWGLYNFVNANEKVTLINR